MSKICSWDEKKKNINQIKKMNVYMFTSGDDAFSIYQK
jgi:hypothetical protein